MAQPSRAYGTSSSVGDELAEVEKELALLRAEGQALRENAAAVTQDPYIPTYYNLAATSTSPPKVSEPHIYPSPFTSPSGLPRKTPAPAGPAAASAKSLSSGSQVPGVAVSKSASVRSAPGGKLAPRISTEAYFSTFLFSANVQTHLRNNGWMHPTEIQHRILPDALAGRDILAIASPWTGKTTAYLLVLLSRINPSVNAIQSIIIVATSETAVKVHGQLYQFLEAEPSAQKRPTVLLSTSETSLGDDRMRLASTPPHVLIVTAVRAAELVQDHTLKIATGVMIVIDEAEKQFGAQNVSLLLFFMAGIRITRQVIICSSAIPITLREISVQVQRDPIEHIVIEQREESESPAARLAREAMIASQEAARIVVEAAKFANSARLLGEKVRSQLRPETLRQLEKIEEREAAAAAGAGAGLDTSY